ncbi:unnamed protein product, partial [Choristocarpus tenellus]
VEDALLSRDQARGLEVQSRRELARVLEARKADAEGHERRVEEALQAQKSKLTAQIDARDREMKELTSQVTCFRAEAERTARDRAGIEAVYLKLKQGVEDEQDAVRARFEEMQGRLMASEALKEQVPNCCKI